MCIMLHQPVGANNGKPLTPDQWRQVARNWCGGASGVLWPDKEAGKVRLFKKQDDHGALETYQHYAKAVEAGLPVIVHMRGHDGYDLNNAQPFLARDESIGYALFRCIHEYDVPAEKLAAIGNKHPSDAARFGLGFLDPMEACPAITSEEFRALVEPIVMAGLRGYESWGGVTAGARMAFMNPDGEVLWLGKKGGMIDGIQHIGNCTGQFSDPINQQIW